MMTRRPSKQLTAKLEKRVARELVAGVLEVAVREGRVDPKGKSERQILNELLGLLEGPLASGTTFKLSFAIDHTTGLLARARNHRKLGEAWLACLFYAIWFEHLLNLMINSIVSRRRLPASTSKQMIRDLPFHAKISWFFPLLGAKPISKRHQDVLKTLAELRNSFIHYKWAYSPISAPDELRLGATALLKNIEWTVSYMRRYDHRMLLYGSKARLNRVAKMGHKVNG
jgi:hypothetical protein